MGIENDRVRRILAGRRLVPWRWAVGMGLILLAAGPVSAAPVTLPVTVFEGGAHWDDIDSDSSGGLHISDASFAGLSDAYDNAFDIFVDGTVHDPGQSADRSEVTIATGVLGTAITGASQTLSGLEVIQQFLFYRNQISGAPTVRILASFRNPTGADIMATVELFGNLGSDGDTTTEATASGDTTVDAGDRWVITSDDPSNSDPRNTIVYFGPGSPTVTPTAITGSGGGDDSVSAIYDITVPAGQTRYLLFFAQLSATTADALASVPVFDTNAALQATGALCDLSQAQLDGILNWTGLSVCASIGDFVWNDLNNNGIQDAGEPGLQNVPVNLRDSTGATVLGSTTTGAGGIYGFPGVPPGSYIVEVLIPLALGVAFSPQNQGADDALDSDVDPATGRAAVVIASSDNNTIDAGVVVVTNLVDQDGDGVPDAFDGCPTDPNKTAPGACGCGVSDADANANGTPDCNDPPSSACGTCAQGVLPGTLLSLSLMIWSRRRLFHGGSA